MQVLILVFVVGLAALLVVFRMAPSDPKRWHVDPATGVSGNGRFVVAPAGGDRTGPVVPLAPEAMLQQIDRIAAATPRTCRLAGDPASGRVTYITRSRVFGFPDYTSVAAMAGDGGAQPVIFARQRFGKSDLGVNRKRVESWLAALERGEGAAGPTSQPCQR
ncbi:DUF1499 domain-containing protein [Tropicimonas sp. IMCC34043]|uniref:DUF1499 domain-containing protein n=1 Tax=Tropicimonas sp. IMCC34043 TaxID=2248760 RepID=UPI000E25056D|nr:DUF1499 domain-containing protein [Tropicimonas sp. IMCC34043]